MISQDQANSFLKAFENKFGPEYTTFAMAVVPTVPLGCSWGFFTDKQYADFGVSDLNIPQGISTYKLADGWLVDAEYVQLVNHLQEVTPIFTLEIIQEAGVRRSNSQKGLEKRLAKGYSEVRLGFYSTNESPNITVGGNTYPAYTVDLATLCQTAEQAGYNIIVGNQVLSPAQVYKHSEDCLKRFHLAPSGNALLTTLSKR